MTYSVVDVKYYVPSGAPGCGKTCTSGTAERPIQLARSRVSHIDVPIKSVPWCWQHLCFYSMIHDHPIWGIDFEGSGFVSHEKIDSDWVNWVCRRHSRTWCPAGMVSFTLLLLVASWSCFVWTIEATRLFNNKVLSFLYLTTIYLCIKLICRVLFMSLIGFAQQHKHDFLKFRLIRSG